MKPFSIIGLKFLDKNGVPSKKTYEYYLDEKMTDYFKSFGLGLDFISFTIVNENSDNYRNSEAVIHYWKKLPLDLRDDLHFIIRAEAKLNCLPRQSRCYDGSTPFDEKEKDMDLEKRIDKICINNETYSLSDILANAQKTATSMSEMFFKANEEAKIAREKYGDLTGVLSNYKNESICNCTINTNKTISPMIHFDSNGIIINNDTELNLNYEKVYDRLEEVKEKRNRKEIKKMFENVMKNFEFGKCGENVKMSVYGPAFKDYNGNYIAFNSDEAIDVTGMTFDFDCFYKMPVAQDDVEIGDYVYHLNDPVKVVDVTERGSLVCVRLFSHEEVAVVPIKNMFGFNFFTKLVNFGEGLFGTNTIDKSNPFGSMLPLFFMSKNGKSDNLMMAMMMSQGNLDLKSNPLMIMALMGENNSEMLPLLMMSQMASKHECKCSECNVPNPID